ncbi:MAG: hypothetical protein NTW78_11200 [Campylobacterales bacterium]|nr:hypothetical protein [Campylobacterales bacterium]
MKSLFSLNIFKKHQKSLKTPESIILKNLKFVSLKNNLLIYENITIYHHSEAIFVPLLILDSTRGVYLFEHKDWLYDDLKNAKIEKVPKREASYETLSFEKSHALMKRKFSEMTQINSLPLHNYVIMEHLNSAQYEHLNSSFQELMPQEKIMFNDLSQDEIIKKIKDIPLPKEPLPDIYTIIGNIVVQYAILDNKNTLNMATKEQQEFIDAPFLSFEILSSPTGSGKTTSFLLKVILQKLRNPNLKIIIIKPTALSCDLLKRKLVNIIDRAQVEFDATEIEIITPLELLNRHLKKLNKAPLGNEIDASKTLVDKEYSVADVIIGDDSDMFSNEFKYYLKQIQHGADLLLVRSNKQLNETYTFNKNFVKENKKVLFVKANPHAKALQIISSLLEFHRPKDILVVSSALSREKLSEDLESYIKDSAVLLDNSLKLIDQDIEKLLLATYSDTNAIEAKFVILMDICFASLIELEYAYNICSDSVYVLHDDECKKLISLRSDFEDSKK